MFEDLLAYVRQLKVPVALLDAYFTALNTFATLTHQDLWRHDVMQVLTIQLEDIVDHGARVKEEMAVRVIYSLGMMAVLVPKLITQDV